MFRGPTAVEEEASGGGRARLPARPLAVSRTDRSRSDRRHEGGLWTAELWSAVVAMMKSKASARAANGPDNSAAGTRMIER